MECLDLHAAALATGSAIMAGDFNSNTRVVGQRTSHPKFVARAKGIGLESAYHFHDGVAHGDETIETFVRGNVRPLRLHIDYCFVSNGLLTAATVTIPRASAWLKRSDHFPLVLDIPDSAFGAPAH